MDIEFDQAKRERILSERNLDLALAADLFAGFHLTRRDDAHSEEEERFVSVGMLQDAVAIVVWTRRARTRRIITMWKANDKERQTYHRQREASG